VLFREPLRAPSGHPCAPEPWGMISAVNLETGTSAWRTPLGTTIPGRTTGTRNVGGPIVTAGGLVFDAASEEALLRAFDSDSGKELWSAALPSPAQATPMSYAVNGRQFVVIAAGGAFGVWNGTWRCGCGIFAEVDRREALHRSLLNPLDGG
jgi:quinoprotein glucose dehydrogenase